MPGPREQRAVPPPPQLVNEQVVYTKDQALYYLNLKPGTIRLAVRSGRLKAHKIGGRYYFLGPDLWAYFQGGLYKPRRKPNPAVAQDAPPEELPS
jgi:excisionase family DNA binding protein